MKLIHLQLILAKSSCTVWIGIYSWLLNEWDPDYPHLLLTSIFFNDKLHAQSSLWQHSNLKKSLQLVEQIHWHFWRRVFWRRHSKNGSLRKMGKFVQQWRQVLQQRQNSGLVPQSSDGIFGHLIGLSTTNKCYIDTFLANSLPNKSFHAGCRTRPWRHRTASAQVIETSHTHEESTPFWMQKLLESFLKTV